MNRSCCKATRSVVALLLLGLAASACGGDKSPCEVSGAAYQERQAAYEVSAASCTSGGTETYRTELFFGFDRKGGKPVSNAEWKKFVDEEITPKFPKGLTVFESYGQYEEPNGDLTCETSRVVILLHLASENRSADIDDIREEYMSRFNQEAVLRIDTLSCVSIETPRPSP